MKGKGAEKRGGGWGRKENGEVKGGMRKGKGMGNRKEGRGRRREREEDREVREGVGEDGQGKSGQRRGKGGGQERRNMGEGVLRGGEFGGEGDEKGEEKGKRRKGIGEELIFLILDMPNNLQPKTTFQYFPIQYEILGISCSTHYCFIVLLIHCVILFPSRLRDCVCLHTIVAPKQQQLFTIQYKTYRISHLLHVFLCLKQITHPYIFSAFVANVQLQFSN